MTTSIDNKDLKNQFNQGITSLKTLRDEIRSEIHLAGMDAKTEWEKLESKFSVAEAFAFKASQESKKAFDDIVDAFKSFQSALKANEKKTP